MVVSVPASGTGTGTLTITPAPDADANDQIIRVTAAAQGYTVGDDELPAMQTVTVVDDDQNNVITIAVDPTELTEGDGPTDVDVSVTLTPAPFEEAIVTVHANSGGFSIATTAITVTANEAMAGGTLSIDPPDEDGNDVDDVIVVTATGSYISGEGEDAVTVTYTGVPTNITVTDKDKEDGTIVLALGATEVQEDAGATDVAVTVTLNPAPSEATDVVVTAMIAGQMHSSTVVTVPTTGTGIGALTITPIDDSAVGDKTVTVTATAIEDYAFLQTAPTITIIDDDAPEKTIALGINPTTLIEGTGAANVAATLTLTPAPPAPVTVTVTATSGGFIIASTDVTVPANSTTGTGNLSITPVDDPDDVDQMVTVAAEAVPGYGTPDAQTLTIEDDDKEQAITLAINPEQLTEEGRFPDCGCDSDVRTCPWLW